MAVTLEAEEAALVRRILTSYLSELRSEIIHTDRYELRQELKQDEVTIKRLTERLARLESS